MIKFARTRPQTWVCRQCVGQLPRRRSLFWSTPASSATVSTSAGEAAAHNGNDSSSAAAAAAAASSVLRTPVDHAASITHDDTTLREIFDSPTAWAAFKASSSAAHGKKTGLFRNAYLTEPAGFLHFTHASLTKAQRIVDKVARASTLDEYRGIVRDLDRLSDLLCRVIDLCDFVRTTPPDAHTQQAANEAWATTYQYMNQLNTTTVLNDQLGIAMANPDVVSGWSEEERTVADMLKLDFTKSAVNLPQASRDRFVELSQQISEVGTRFVDSMAPADPWVALPSTSCRGLDPTVASRFTRGATLRLPAVSAEAALALRTVQDEDARKKIYYASRTASQASVRLLEQMLGLRSELAQLAGFDSYAHMALRDRMMAKTPESVHQFLLALSRSNAPLVEREVQDLVAAKRYAQPAAQHATEAETTLRLNPWDRDFYMSVLRQAAGAPTGQVDPTTGQRLVPKKRSGPLSHYFSLGTVMQGLSRLFQRLYGLRFVPRETPPGETWHPDVRRLDVVSDTDGHVAVLYCDLFYRGDKSPNPAHFTVRCSREIAPDEIAEAAAADGALSVDNGLTPQDAANDGMATSRDRTTGAVKQLPTIALVCDFARSDGGGGTLSSLFGQASSKSKPALLSYHEVETLFHEMGHAVHSVLARTSLQTVAGTRCATDLAELPSTLMEQFVADPEVLALFARHYETDVPVDYEQVAEGLRRARRFEGLDDENQIVLAMLDQAYHGTTPVGDHSTDMFHGLQRAVMAGGGPVDPSGTCWQGFFGHLFGYGSTYYSYLFDRVLAERVWRVVFQGGQDGGALRRANGEHLRDSLLRHGGGRDPWRCVSDALRDSRLAAGDAAAMALVGSWGTSHRR
ncbi:mitochondrial intermediate peptidase [Sporothrix schenckii 1099-18]|uniref:Mitochondrial intermediate peptidase n=1 Tax=Sporothrix schenckii 1099-18 TaxID=1397361 RepID=A0A0F2MAB1_SPOSC|nr:mitochondrial intermediate peptidase [Sporothrix schenckii 1099-18]KJR86577.1 mitochondrial intermediate peptidase [Sporothrix schenckii 1099-18]